MLCHQPLPARVHARPRPVTNGCRSVVVCVVCGHQQARNSGRERVTCPDCGSTAWNVNPADPAS